MSIGSGLLFVTGIGYACEGNQAWKKTVALKKVRCDG